MKLLIHICCAPCSIVCVQALRDEGIEPTGYWYNPNIHPFTEYRARRDTLKEYAASIGLALAVNDTYGLRPFTRAVAADIDGRCRVCYAARMRETARYAAENGFTHFTSTLFVSPYQNHELLRETAEAAAQAFGVAFLYRDFRPGFRDGQQKARELGLYLQKYCGCAFSEEERYRKRNAVARDAAKSLPGPRPLTDALREQTERALWEVGNVLDCLDDALWDKLYCGAPAWKHAYHLLHSLDRWYINPFVYEQPPFHTAGLDDLDAPAAGRLTRDELRAYQAEIAVKLRAYLDSLADAELNEKPEGCPYTRFTLALAQFRHLHSHMGMLMGFVIADTGRWPTVLGLERPFPDGTYDRYC